LLGALNVVAADHDVTEHCWGSLPVFVAREGFIALSCQREERAPPSPLAGEGALRVSEGRMRGAPHVLFSVDGDRQTPPAPRSRAARQ
jgi:hypothetical protein